MRELLLGINVNNFFKNISFTKNETQVIIFVITVLVAGFSIKYYKEILNNNSEYYDFSKSDIEFKNKSENALKFKSFLLESDSSNNDEELIKKLQTLDDSINTNNKVSSNIGFLEKSINLNTASKEQLVELPGIGEITAEKIIIYRDEKNGFKKIEDLMKVKGIGKKKFENIKAYIKAE